MTTITREQLIEKLQNRIAVTANYPGVEEAQLDAAIFKIALASLEAEPIGAFHIEDQQVSGTTDYIKDGEWPIDNGVIDVYAVPPASVVPEEMPKGLAGQIVSLLAHNIGDKFLAQKIWNACRAAMLQGVEQPQNARQNIPENIPDGNSPAIPDDWVMVPKEPTQAMIKAWLSEVANFRGHAAGYKAALAAAPQREVK
ncbi:hypothetical protein IIF72_003688 [Salmonella enterica]|nr:hypothetical protein [Salmonella enterica]EHM1667892.1 hypothetical protein [Salmonella enterica subsp. enterica serovar Oranienburg]ECX7939630.1 hypothetical protein [Salmonella enterica]EGN2288904.1 hypothetical protein [Salmonella enterica]EGO7181653.1 hypothetical protein [Salmonella enterica]